MGVRGPHGREDLSHKADVFLHTSFLNDFLIDRKDSCVYLVSKDLEERHEVLDAVEVGWDLNPSTEAVPLPPGCGFLVGLGIGEAFGDSRMCSIVCSRRFAADGRRHILQG